MSKHKERFIQYPAMYSYGRSCTSLTNSETHNRNVISLISNCIMRMPRTLHAHTTSTCHATCASGTHLLHFRNHVPCDMFASTNVHKDHSSTLEERNASLLTGERPAVSALHMCTCVQADLLLCSSHLCAARCAIFLSRTSVRC